MNNLDRQWGDRKVDPSSSFDFNWVSKELPILLKGGDQFWPINKSAATLFCSIVMLYTTFAAIKHGVLYSKAWEFFRSVHGIRSRSHSEIALCVTGRKISPNIRQPNKQRNNSWESRGSACGRPVRPKHRRLCRGIGGWNGKLQRRIRPSLNWVDVGSPNISEASWGTSPLAILSAPAFLRTRTCDIETLAQIWQNTPTPLTFSQKSTAASCWW